MDALEAVWTARPDDREGLSLGRIVAAAIALADAEGLAAVSMARIAKALGFTTMSLYRHVGSKEELILHMQDAAVGPPPERETEPDEDWRPAVERWAWGTCARMRAHPWILQTLPVLGPPATPHQLTWLEHGLRALRATPLSEPEKLQVILLINAHVFGDVIFAGAEVADDDSYERLFTTHLDPGRFPALIAAFTGGAFAETDDPEGDRDSRFAFGLTRILDGVAQLIGSR
ncbi:TetR/AcrR family transcriptional regulator [Pseudonocardia sp. WMMC193]|uniref:TetR/AcrR family transcriptional regulator n=1 Tax=Pseudonocardia sp. WMMC193 TaxID=2911965 RepID=UPI001F1F16EE|nr:TetR/AcrR family transcriptional regulator [Pseudonocardia sp. WMMC193]MCF7550037.1 TetR/AcrR family transcriptional regulator [Pseudonocardia sp. WMMC193]